MLTLDDEDVYWMIRAMERFGGSFVQQLARLLQLADEDNTRRILETWPEYVDKYVDMGHTLKEREG